MTAVKISNVSDKFKERDKISNEIKNLLLQELRFLKNYGVDHLGYRYFLCDGRSFGCPTVDQWYMERKPQEFYNSMKLFLTKELINFAENNFTYVTRSNSHSPNEYQKYLRAFSLGSSIGIYKTATKRIDSFFFITNSDLGEARDVLINNIHWLENYTNELSLKINKMLTEILHFKEVDINIDKYVCKKVFDRIKLTDASSIDIISNGRVIKLTNREIDILKNLNLGSSNKKLAAILNISEKTIEKHLSNIKTKFNVSCKNDLLKLSAKVQFRVFN
ncbi:MAG: helix-turn-helix transcriptional regulator [Rickettsiaceae bacterium]|nr:helix-turn-helix transcriptional regulator [Rickettsiaceae bacterium]